MDMMLMLFVMEKSPNLKKEVVSNMFVKVLFETNNIESLLHARYRVEDSEQEVRLLLGV